MVDSLFAQEPFDELRHVEALSSTHGAAQLTEDLPCQPRAVIQFPSVVLKSRSRSRNLRRHASLDRGSEPTAPVGNVNWFEAVAYANRLSETHIPALEPCYTLSGCEGEIGGGDLQDINGGMTCATISLSAPTVYECDGFRLPTQAEWEYAARAGTTTAFYGGDILPQGESGDCIEDPALLPIAWYCANAAGRTHPVGQKAANAFGLFDILGNAFEWVSDPYRPNGYGIAPLVDHLWWWV